MRHAADDLPISRLDGKSGSILLVLTTGSNAVDSHVGKQRFHKAEAK